MKKKKAFLKRVDCIEVFIKLPELIFHNKLIAYITLKYTRAYSRHLLRAVPAHNALFDIFLFFCLFSHSKNFKSAFCLGGFHVQIALNLLKKALFRDVSRNYLGIAVFLAK